MLQNRLLLAVHTAAGVRLLVLRMRSCLHLRVRLSLCIRRHEHLQRIQLCLERRPAAGRVWLGAGEEGRQGCERGCCCSRHVG